MDLCGGFFCRKATVRKKSPPLCGILSIKERRKDMNETDWESVLRFIEEHLNEELTLEKIADAAGYSRYHFSRKFRETQGISVMKYVLRRKMEKASQEILRGRSILETALDFGFSSHSSFSTVFRREMGYHPSLLKLKKEIAGGMYMRKNEAMTKEELYEKLSERCGEMFEKCCALSCQIYSGQRRYSGEEYVTHPLNAALLLANAEAEEPVILAGLFCDWYKKGRHTEHLAEQLPAEVRKIVEELPETDPDKLSDEALLVKTAERLHNMQTLEHMEESVWKKKAEDTMILLAAVNARIGKNNMTEELRELAVKYLKNQTGAR